MNRRNSVPLLLAATGLLVARTFAAESFEDAMKREAAIYRDRQIQAAEMLQQARDRVAKEKAPLLQKIRAAQDRVIQADTELRRIELEQERVNEQRRNLMRQIDDVGRTTTYVNTLVHDGLKSAQEALPPGESTAVSDQLEAQQQTMEKAASGARAQAAADGAEFLLAQIQRSLGGHMVSGRSLSATDNQLYPGTFAFIGPETYFRSEDGTQFGSVRTRDGSAFPTTHPIARWKAQDAAVFFATGNGTIPVDASAGKALKLVETKGSVWDHIKKGGLVAFAILGAGLAALVMIVQKTTQLLRMGIEPETRIRPVLEAIATNDLVRAQQLIGEMRGATAEIFVTGLAQRDAPKPVLEEIIQSVLLEQRLHYERRLPLLAVIATAAPLMGLLGTVVGMVRTFALITVFGTGNAGKLSSGISEVLVATELGLLVAIPTLIAHGFLAHRIHKNLARLEKYALQFVTAVALGRGEAEARALVK